MLPKFHPELNPIEQFWAAVKCYLRQECGCTLAALRENIPQALRAVPAEQVRRYFRRAERFESIYRFEAQSGTLPESIREYAMKKYKKHRGVPVSLLQDISKDLLARKASLDRSTHQGTRKLTQAKLSKVNSTLADLNEVRTAMGV